MTDEALREPSIELPILERHIPQQTSPVTAAETTNDVAVPTGRVIDARPLVDEIRRVELKLTEYRGPIPAPEVLAEYAELGYSDRLIDAFEAELEYRRQRDTEERSRRHELALARQRTQQQITKRGQLFGAGMATLVLAGAVWLILAGHTAAGLGLIGADFVGVGGAFVYGQVENRRRQAQPQQDSRQQQPRQRGQQQRPQGQSRRRGKSKNGSGRKR